MMADGLTEVDTVASDQGNLKAQLSGLLLAVRYFRSKFSFCVRDL